MGPNCFYYLDGQKLSFEEFKSKVVSDSSLLKEYVPQSETAVPDAPFRGEGWKRLGIKKLIELAIREGKDRIGWTQGEVQADRYDLSKHFNKIRAYKAKDGEKTWNIQATDKEGKVHLMNAKDDAALADTIGKDLAEKIIEGGGETVTFEGIDLKIGGKGMRGFYDSELVNIANDIGKPFGARVSKAKIPVENRAETKGDPSGLKPVSYDDAIAAYKEGKQIWARGRGVGNYTPVKMGDKSPAFILDMFKDGDGFYVADDAGVEVWSLPITERMKQVVSSEGLPMFSPKGEKRDVMKELDEEGALEGADEEIPKETLAYFAIGHDDPKGQNWIYRRTSNSIESKTGGSHGSNFGHEIAGNTFKGWYDTERDIVSVVFPPREMDKLDHKPTEDDIPTGVHKSIRSKFGKDAAIVVFSPKDATSFNRSEKDSGQPLKQAIAWPTNEEDKLPLRGLALPPDDRPRLRLQLP